QAPIAFPNGARLFEAAEASQGKNPFRYCGGVVAGRGRARSAAFAEHVFTGPAVSLRVIAFEFLEKLDLLNGFYRRRLFRPDQANRLAGAQAFVNEIGSDGSSGPAQTAFAMHRDWKCLLSAQVNERNDGIRLFAGRGESI